MYGDTLYLKLRLLLLELMLLCLNRLWLRVDL